MKSCITFLLAVFMLQTLPAQIIYQNTSIRELNSNRKPLGGVFVKFEHAGSTNSDTRGFVQLVFQGLNAGDLIFLEDIKKSGFEIVNRKDFEVMKISSNTDLGTDIIMARKGVVDAAKKEYYGLSDKALLHGFEKEKKALRTKLKNAQLKQEDYFTQLQGIQEKYEEQKASLDALASKFARINFDDVEPVYQEALELFKKGNINEAIAKLEAVNPTARTAQIMREEERIIRAQQDLDAQKEQLALDKEKQIATIQLLADMYNLNFELAKAEDQYDQLLLLDSTNLEILIKAADFYKTQHLYVKAKRAFLKIIEHPQSDTFNIATSFLHLGRLHIQTGDYAEALQALEQSHLLTQNLYEQNPEVPYFKKELVVVKLNLTRLLLSHLGDLDQALSYDMASLEMSKELNNAYPQDNFYKSLLANSYQNQGEINQAMGMFDQAFDFYKKFNQLYQEIYHADTTNAGVKDKLAISYDKLGSVCFSLDSLHASLENYETAARLAKELSDANPKSINFKRGLAISYSKMGQVHSRIGSLDMALSSFETYHALAGELKEAYPENVNFKRDFVTATGALGDTYNAMGNLPKALTFYEKELSLAEELYQSSPQNIYFKNSLATSNVLLGLFCRDRLNDPEQAKKYLRTAEKLWSELVKEAPDVAQFENFLNQVREELKKLD